MKCKECGSEGRKGYKIILKESRVEDVEFCCMPCVEDYARKKAEEYYAELENN